MASDVLVKHEIKVPTETEKDIGWGLELSRGTFFQWGKIPGVRAFVMESRPEQSGLVLLTYRSSLDERYSPRDPSWRTGLPFNGHKCVFLKIKTMTTQASLSALSAASNGRLRPETDIQKIITPTGSRLFS